jgi:hypothetical protein
MKAVISISADWGQQVNNVLLDHKKNMLLLWVYMYQFGILTFNWKTTKKMGTHVNKKLRYNIYESLLDARTTPVQGREY